ncbi:MAG: CocE/NonD family hydrolase [Candidatus Hodarchaeota archaeon]
MSHLTDLGDNPFQYEEGYSQKLKYKKFTIQSTYIPMRDGVEIAATICIPKGLPQGEKIPTALFQTRYWRTPLLRAPLRWIFPETFGNKPFTEVFTRRGYAIIYTDVRGTGASTGSRPTALFSEAEVKDGNDILDWIIKQPWSDGNVVTFGISYTGSTAEFLATNGHSALKATMPLHCYWDTYEHVAYPGGVYTRSFMELWSFLGKHLDQNSNTALKRLSPISWLLARSVRPVASDKDRSKLKEATRQHLANKYVHEMARDLPYRDDSLLEGLSYATISIYPYKEQLETSNIPIYALSSWLDSGYGEAVINRFLSINNPMIAILGNWNHGARTPAKLSSLQRPKRVNPAIRNRSDLVHHWIDFFDTCLKGEGIKGKTLYYFTMGEEKWKKTSVWPPEGQQMQRWYLGANNSLSITIPQESTGADSYTVNFEVSTGNRNRWWTLLGLPIDYSNRAVQDKLLLTYTSHPLEEDLEITGHAFITLFLRSTHEDGAIFVYLEAVDPQGIVNYLTDGQLRLIHRKISSEEPPYKRTDPYHSFKREDNLPLVPGEVTGITFGLLPVSAQIRKGHRIRIAIAGADKDTFTRYPAEGTPTITIERNNTQASFIDLPIIQKEGK